VNTSYRFITGAVFFGAMNDTGFTGRCEIIGLLFIICEVAGSAGRIPSE
jgi:hypothetical protein